MPYEQRPDVDVPIDRSVYERVVRAAAADGVSVRGWLDAVVRRALIVREGLDGVAAWERLNGALTDEEMAAARRRVASESAARP